jgi:hypothetical protein
LGENAATQVSGIAKVVQYGAFLGGLVLVVMGLFDFYKAGSSPQHTVGSGAKKCVVGAVLLGLGAIITAFSASIFGSDQSSGMGEIGL